MLNFCGHSKGLGNNFAGLKRFGGTMKDAFEDIEVAEEVGTTAVGDLYDGVGTSAAAFAAVHAYGAGIVQYF